VQQALAGSIGQDIQAVFASAARPPSAHQHAAVDSHSQPANGRQTLPRPGSRVRRDYEQGRGRLIWTAASPT